MTNNLKEEIDSLNKKSRKLYRKLEKTEKNICLTKEKTCNLLDILQSKNKISNVNKIVYHIKQIDSLIEDGESTDKLFEYFYNYFKQKNLESKQINTIKLTESLHKDIAHLKIYNQNDNPLT